jgi:serine/threonine-protein kinase RsbW
VKDDGAHVYVADPLTLADLSAIRAFVRAALSEVGCAAAVDPCTLAVDEVCANLVEHASSAAGGPTRVMVRRDGFDAIIVVEDHGIPFDPANAPPPNLSTNWEERPIGGLGWFFVKQLMDGVHYTSTPTAKGQVNRLTLTKRGAAPPIPESPPA